MDIVSEADNSTAYTPPESVAADFKEDDDHVATTEPRSGSTFIIRSVASGEVITLSDGQVTLSHPDGHGCNEWICIEDFNGWLGFRNRVAGRLLGYGEGWTLRCAAIWHRTWEKFRARKRPGGYILVMPHWWWGSQPVAIKEGDNMKRLAIIKSWESEEAVWEFVKL